jgi:hypothetical protein
MPSALVVAVRAVCVARLVMVTVAPEMAAFEASVTTPCMAEF